MGKRMEMPKFEKNEKATCAGCAALILLGGSMDVSLVTFPCGITVPGLAA